MKKEYSSKEEIIEKAKEITKREGLSNLSMRKLSSECYLALGTLYHYFASKEELILALMENYWLEKFQSSFSYHTLERNFIDAFEQIYEIAKKSFDDFERLFIKRQVDGAKTLMLRGKEKQKYFVEQLKLRLNEIALKDPNVKHDNFDETFTLDSFISTLFQELLTSLMNHEDKKDYLKALITRIIY